MSVQSIPNNSAFADARRDLMSAAIGVAAFKFLSGRSSSVSQLPNKSLAFAAVTLVASATLAREGLRMAFDRTNYFGTLDNNSKMSKEKQKASARFFGFTAISFFAGIIGLALTQGTSIGARLPAFTQRFGSEKGLFARDCIIGAMAIAQGNSLFSAMLGKSQPAQKTSKREQRFDVDSDDIQAMVKSALKNAKRRQQ